MTTKLLSTNRWDKPCFEGDEYIADIYEHLSMWRVRLNNGHYVYQDCWRRGSSSWINLKSFCEAHRLYITEMRVSFRNCYHHLPSGADGYYFINSAGCIWGVEKTFHYYVVGILRDGIIQVERVRVPELIIEEQEIRQINEETLECLIQKPLNLQN